MTDRSDGAMTPFEVRLARDLHALSAEAVRRVDSERVVENLAGAHTVGPAWMTRPPGLRPWMRLLVAAALAVALIASVLLLGAGARQLIDPGPLGRGVSVSPERLRIWTTTDPGPLEIAPPTGYQAWDTSDLETISWAPDARSVLVGACEVYPCFKGAGPGSGSHDLFRVWLDGQPPTQLTNGSTPAYGAVTSPDGRWIAYTGCHHTGGTHEFGCDPRGYHVGVMRADGTDQRILDESTEELGSGAGIYLWWSSDGRRLTYTYTRGYLPDGCFEAPIDQSAPPIRIGDRCSNRPYQVSGDRYVRAPQPGGR